MVIGTSLPILFKLYIHGEIGTRKLVSTFYDLDLILKVSVKKNILKTVNGPDPLTNSLQILRIAIGTPRTVLTYHDISCFFKVTVLQNI